MTGRADGTATGFEAGAIHADNPGPVPVATL
jgi:hypothetical protein